MGVAGLFLARAEMAAKTSGTCNTFHGLPGDKLCQFKLLTDDLGLWANSSMFLPDSLVMVLHGQAMHKAISSCSEMFKVIFICH